MPSHQQLQEQQPPFGQSHNDMDQHHLQQQQHQQDQSSPQQHQQHHFTSQPFSVPHLAPSSSSFPFNSLVAAADTINNHHDLYPSSSSSSNHLPSTSALPSNPPSSTPTSMASSSAAAPASTPKVALGRTRCYWCILSPSLDYIFTDPILDAHLGDQKQQFLGTNLLDYVHPEEKEALQNDLMPKPGALGGVESAGIFGSVTRCRYSRVPQIRRLLGCAEPETDPEASLIAYDNSYLEIIITTSWIGGGEPGVGGEEGDELHGAVLCFFHATENKNESQDNDESKRSHWSNWCGPLIENGPYLDESRCAELEAALARATSFDPSKGRSPSDGPPPHVFQILNNEGRAIVTFPPPKTRGYEYDPVEYAALGKQVVAKPRPAHESTTSCTRRYRDKHPVLKDGSLVSIESVVILYGAITFCVYDTGGIYLTAAAKQRAAVAAVTPSHSSPASSRASASPRVAQAAKTFELEDVPFLNGSDSPNNAAPKRLHPENDFSLPPHQDFKRPKVEAPLGPQHPLDSSASAPSNRLSPGDRHRGQGGVSPTIASSAAILGSFGTHAGGQPVFGHHDPNSHVPGAHDPFRPWIQPQFGGANHQSLPTSYSHPLYHQQLSPQHMYPSYPQHPLASAQQHSYMHQLPPPHPNLFQAYQAANPPLPPLTSSYSGAHSPANFASHPLFPTHRPTSAMSNDTSAAPVLPSTDLSETPSHNGLSTSLNTLPPSSDQTQQSVPNGTPSSSKAATGKSSTKKEKLAKARAEGQIINKPGPAACESCGSAESPEWRKGPSGNKSLCNACGLRYARQVARQAKLAAAAASGQPMPKKGKKAKKAAEALAAIEGHSDAVNGVNPSSNANSMDEAAFLTNHDDVHGSNSSTSPHSIVGSGFHLPSNHTNGFGPNDHSPSNNDHSYLFDPAPRPPRADEAHHHQQQHHPMFQAHHHRDSILQGGMGGAGGIPTTATSYRPYEWSAARGGEDGEKAQ